MRAAAVALLSALVLAGLAGAGTRTTATIIVTIVGTGTSGQTGDGGLASTAEIVHPRGIVIAPGGGFVFADAFAYTVRRVWPNGTITTVAGTGVPGFSGDGGPATSAQLNEPHGVAFTADGTLLIADALNNRIRAVSPGGTITTVAGTGTAGFAGDGGPASAAELSAPHGVSVLPSGGYLVPDTDNDRVRLVRPDGTITTVAGNGVAGFSGDGGPAVDAELDRPFAAVPTADGGFLIVDSGNSRIRKVSADGTISTVAGNGVRGFGGDGGPAVQAELNGPHNLAVLPDGGFLIADALNNRVRRVWPDGTITTVAGTGTAGFSGDGGPPADAELDQPKALALLPKLQGFLVADAVNSRIRLVTLDLRPPLQLVLRTRTLRTRFGTPAGLTFDLSAAATVRVDTRSGTRLVTRKTVRAHAGRNILRLGGGLKPGRYSLVVRASAVLEQPAQAVASLVVWKRR
jgi:hypothetical protein